MLVQICCSVDSHYFLRKLKEIYPDERIIGYFYDPNIHPYSEFLLRYEDVKKSAKALGIEVILGDYELDEWFRFIKGLENEPEKGERCQKCFDFRMEKTAILAKKLGESSITTTLLMSPKKSHAQLQKSLSEICAKFNLDFVAPDFRKNGGSKAQFDLAKKDNLYHQNYCGCMFAMKMQNKASLEFELMSAINHQIWLNSPEDRVKFYRNLRALEKQKVKFRLQKDSFINYRLLRGLVKFDEKVIKSYFLFNSHFERNLMKFSINYECDEFVKNEIRVFSFDKFKELLGLKFKSFDEFLKNPLSVNEELNLREKICEKGSFSPIIVIEKLVPAKVEIVAFSKIYLDVREILVTF